MNYSDLFSRPFTFARRSKSVSCDLRPLWKCCLLIVVFDLLSKNNRCSLKKIHVACWLLRDPSRLDELEGWKASAGAILPEVRFDPIVDRSVEVLLGEGYLRKVSGKLEITEKGLQESFKLADIDVFSQERDLLSRSKKIIHAESSVSKLFKVV